MTDNDTTIAILEESRDLIIDIMAELDTANYFDMHRAEELDYDLGQIEMEISEYSNKN